MDDLPQRPPATLDALLRRTRALGFDAACEARTGSLLRVLAASNCASRRRIVSGEPIRPLRSAACAFSVWRQSWYSRHRSLVPGASTPFRP